MLILQRFEKAHEDIFLAAVDRSRELHSDWVSPPSTPEAFRSQLEKCDGESNIGFIVMGEPAEPMGCINLNEIVRGCFQSAYLGFYAFEPFAGKGLMAEALRLVIKESFGPLGLHRLEANIQPGNERSIALVELVGFRREGLSPRYLKIADEWRDHARYAITAEEGAA